MKAILALLLGLISSSFANRMDDSVVLEFESPDSAEQSQISDDVGSGSSQSYNGIIIQVRQGINESPTIALGSDIDDYDDVYCLNFVGLFEASSYDTLTTTNSEFTEIDDTRIDLADANCITFPETDTVFSIVCDNINDESATLTLTFTFIQDEQGDYGLEYIINLADYTLSDSAANLVMVQSLNECGDLIDIDAESAEEDTEEDTEESEEHTPEPTEADSTEETTADNGIIAEGGRRRLLQTTTDSTEDDTPEPTETESAEEDEEESTDTDTSVETDEESIEEGDGISEDDSGEFDSGFARFVVNAQALDVCSNEDQSEVDSSLVYQEDDDELHIVFGRFSCTLVLDPFYGLDESKYDKVYGKPSTTEDNANSFNIFIASIIGLIAYLW